MLCARCWAFCGGLIQGTCKGVTVSQESVISQIERGMDRICAGQEVAQGQHGLQGMVERMGSRVREGDGAWVRWEG